MKSASPGLAAGIAALVFGAFAMGAALGLHPLAVLIVTIAGGARFGGIGLILAAPLTAAGLRIATDIAKAKEAEARGGAPGGLAPEAAPG